jgi:putative endopeptidase
MGLMIKAGNSTATGTNLHEWWTAEDSKEYERRAQCISDEYSVFEATEGVKLNGKLRLGENTADNGGLRIALMALESTLSQQPSHAASNGFTPQQEFFISYAETWCSNATHQYLSMMAQSNPHSTAQARANGVVSNMPEFQKAFGCKKGSP